MLKTRCEKRHSPSILTNLSSIVPLASRTGGEQHLCSSRYPVALAERTPSDSTRMSHVRWRLPAARGLQLLKYSRMGPTPCTVPLGVMTCVHDSAEHSELISAASCSSCAENASAAVPARRSVQACASSCTLRVNHFEDHLLLAGLEKKHAELC